MGTGVLALFAIVAAPHHPNPFTHPNNILTNKYQQVQSKNASGCCFCTSKYGGSQWERRTGGTHKQQPTYPHHEFYGFDEEDFSGFKNGGKQRIWWSEDSSSWDYDNDDEEENGSLFGVFEGSLGFSSIFKVLRGFGWMIPAVVISMLLGTGTDSFFMAMVLPLAQSALAVAFDSLWGTYAESVQPKVRSRKRRGAVHSSEARKRRLRKRETTKSTDDYESWVAANDGAAKKGEGKKRNFGGWDDLDKHWSKGEMPKPAPLDEKKLPSEGRLSRRGRNRSTPLLMRMLHAFFPFLGFWSKLL